MIHAHAYYNAAAFAEVLFALMCVRGLNATRLADLIARTTGYKADADVIDDLARGNSDTEPTLPFILALIETLEPSGGIMFVNPAFSPDTILHVRHLRQERECQGEVA
jgi:hypothetical protein